MARLHARLVDLDHVIASWSSGIAAMMASRSTKGELKQAQ
jgi:hypothetical protein